MNFEHNGFYFSTGYCRYKFCCVSTLPATSRDEDYEQYHNLTVEDEDVLMLFGDMANFALSDKAVQMMRVANLHPREWFFAFKDEDITSHLS